MKVPQTSPSALLRYDSVVRVTQYVWLGTARRLRSRFLIAWQEEFGASSPQGVGYRELCRQVPEWSGLASREIDNPIEAAFIEYMIVEPWVDLLTIPALPEGWQASYSTIADIHSVAFHFSKESAGAAPGALMFNLFEIDGPAEMEQGFLMAWPPRGEFKIHEPAVISTVLHQRMLPDARVKAFNRVEATSAEDYAGGIDRFQEAFPRAERKAARRRPRVVSHPSAAISGYSRLQRSPPPNPAFRPKR